MLGRPFTLSVLRPFHLPLCMNVDILTLLTFFLLELPFTSVRPNYIASCILECMPFHIKRLHEDHHDSITASRTTFSLLTGARIEC